MTNLTADVTHVEECSRKFALREKDQEPLLVMNVPYTGILECGILRFGPSGTHVILRVRNIVLHMSWYGKQ